MNTKSTEINLPVYFYWYVFSIFENRRSITIDFEQDRIINLFDYSKNYISALIESQFMIETIKTPCLLELSRNCPKTFIIIKPLLINMQLAT